MRPSRYAKAIVAIALAVAGLWSILSQGNTDEVICEFADAPQPPLGAPQPWPSDELLSAEPPSLKTLNIGSPDARDFVSSVESFYQLRSWAIFYLADEPDRLFEIASPLLWSDSPVSDGIHQGLLRQAREDFRIKAKPSQIEQITFGQPLPSEDRAPVCVRELLPGDTVWVDIDTEAVVRSFNSAEFALDLVFDWRRNEDGVWQLWEITTPHIAH